MKRLTFKSPLSLMILFIATNSQPLFSNDITVAPKLSLRIRNTIYEYIKNIRHISVYMLTSFMYLFSVLVLISSIKYTLTNEDLSCRNFMRDLESDNHPVLPGICVIYIMITIPTLLIVPFINLIPAINLLYQSYSCLLTIAPPLVIFVGAIIISRRSPASGKSSASGRSSFEENEFNPLESPAFDENEFNPSGSAAFDEESYSCYNSTKRRSPGGGSSE